MTTDKEFAESAHQEVHVFRRVPNYKASAMDNRISKLVIEKFSSSCRECRERAESIKNTPKETSFIENIGKIITG